MQKILGKICFLQKSHAIMWPKERIRLQEQLLSGILPGQGDPKNNFLIEAAEAAAYLR